MNLIGADLQYFPDLSQKSEKELYVDSNTLRVIPAEFLPLGIQTLSLADNRICSDGLPVVFPDTLKILILDRNKIRDLIDVVRFPTNLKHLSLSDNPLSTLENLPLETLETLFLNCTSLEGISMLPKHLQVLEASKCYKLNMIPNRLPSTIRIVRLHDNRLRYAGLPGYWGTCLEELDLAYNEIEQFPRNLPPTLKILNLTHNKIGKLPTDLNTKFPNLEALFVSHNKIREVPVAPRRKKLMIVDIRNNELTVSLQSLNAAIEDQWAINISETRNWNSPQHQFWARLIQKNWRISRIRARIRIWRRTGILKEELWCVSMMPERVWQTDVLSQEWKRP